MSIPLPAQDRKPAVVPVEREAVGGYDGRPRDTGNPFGERRDQPVQVRPLIHGSSPSVGLASRRAESFPLGRRPDDAEGSLSPVLRDLLAAGDMRNLPGLLPGGTPPIGDATGEALLGGHLPPGDAGEGLRPLAEAIAALTVAPSARELAGEPEARAAYHAGFSPARGTRARRRRIRLAASLLSVKLAAAAAVAAGGLTAAAYADVLPAPVQTFAHQTLRAPAPHPDPAPGPTVTPSSPAPARPATHGRRGSHPAGQPSAASSPTPAAAASGQAASHPPHLRHPSHPPRPSHPGPRPSSHPAGKPARHP